MNKTFTILTTLSASILLSACVAQSNCTSDDLDGCGRGHAYTEERTALFEKPEAPVPVVVETPAPAPAPIPEPAIIEPEPEPIVEPIQGTAQPVFDERLTK